MQHHFETLSKSYHVVDLKKLGAKIVFYVTYSLVTSHLHASLKANLEHALHVLYLKWMGFNLEMSIVKMTASLG